jgi:hypothetical protein
VRKVRTLSAHHICSYRKLPVVELPPDGVLLPIGGLPDATVQKLTIALTFWYGPALTETFKSRINR